MLRVLLLQLPVPNNPATNVPLAAGYLKAYAHAQGLLDHVQIDILPRALADYAGDALLVDEVVAHGPDVLGLSLYTWNSERSLALAARVRARLPGLLVVAGGPEAQPDNEWLRAHPAVDVAVIGEGEQTFAELLRLLIESMGRKTRDTETRDTETRDVVSVSPCLLVSLSGIAYRDAGGALVVNAPRAALSDLAPLPSPYLLGYLEPSPIMLIEVSRWCPYACSFCLYGRNMGAKLGSRYFPLERLLAELAWGRAQGATQIHFVEANLNLVPVFWPLMQALADLNADGALALYAELRGEHLTDAAVAALARAGLRVAEVGLQTANPQALRVAQRRTDLAKWAAGTRRLAAQGVEVYLDVILGLPADDTAGVAATLAFIEREQLGAYDVFTLQVLPGTATRGQAGEYALAYQERPPYYILGTDRLSYAELRRLRRTLKQGAGLDSDAVEGCPPPRLDALEHTHGVVVSSMQYAVCSPASVPSVRSVANKSLPHHNDATPIDRLWLADAGEADWRAAPACINWLATHVDVVARWADAERLGGWLAQAIAANPSTLFDCYLLAEQPPPAHALALWRAALPYVPGYLDRVAVYRREAPGPGHDRVSPRLWLVLPWAAQADPSEYQGVAEIIWAYALGLGEPAPLGAWAAAGGAGVWVRGQAAEALARWRAEVGVQIWG